MRNVHVRRNNMALISANVITTHQDVMKACMREDLSFISECIAEGQGRDGYGVAWQNVLHTAFSRRYSSIVTCIRNSGFLTLQAQLMSACEYGDIDFVRECTLDKLDMSHNVDWWRLKRLASDMGQTDIVNYIVSMGRLAPYKKMLSGGVTYISQLLGDSSDENVNWWGLTDAAYIENRLDIVRALQKTGKVSINDQLWLAGYNGDLEFVHTYLSDKISTDQEIDWGRLLHATYHEGHHDITRCILETMSMSDKIWFACCNGQWKLVSQYACTSRECVDWERGMDKAYQRGHDPTVVCIAARENASVQEQLFGACLEGDLQCLQKHIEENTCDLLHVNWQKLIGVAYSEGHLEIVRCIQGSEKMTKIEMLECALRYYDVQYASDYFTGKEDGTIPKEKVMQEITNASTIVKDLIRHGRVRLHHILWMLRYQECNDLICSAIDHMEEVTIFLFHQLTVLHAACYYANFDIVRILATKGIGMDTVGYKGQTPLHMACLGRNEEMTCILEEYHSVKLAEYRQSKKLVQSHMYSSDGLGEHRCKLVEFLLQRGVNVNIEDHCAKPPLHLACITGDRKIAELLIEGGANIDHLDRTLMSAAATAVVYGHYHITKMLLEKGSIVNESNSSAESILYLASKLNHCNIVNLLLENGALLNQKDYEGVTPVSIASWNGHAGVVSLLLKKGADSNLADDGGQTPLHKVALTRYMNTAKVLVQHSSTNLDIQDATGCTPLHTASKENKDLVQLLLGKYCKVDVINNQGNTALHIAVLAGQVDIVKVLLSYQANINHKNRCGISPLLAVVPRLNVNMNLLELLVQHGADVETADNMGRGLMHAVVNAFSFNQKVGEYLLTKHVSVNVADCNKQTPLHLAAESGRLQAVSFLLGRGADIQARDKFDNLPVMASVQHPHMFKHLWGKSCKHLLDQDLRQIMLLAHWFDEPCVQHQLSTSDNCFKAKFSTHAQCVRDLTWSDDSDGFTPWLKQDNDDWPDCMSGWLPSLQTLTYVPHPDVLSVIASLIRDMEGHMGNNHPLFAFDILMSGSEDESTKVMATDELDILCVFKKIRHDMFHMPTSPSDANLGAYVVLTCKDVHQRDLARVLENRGHEAILSPAKLFKNFKDALCEVLSMHPICEKYKQIGRVTTGMSDANSNIPAFKIRWHDDIYPCLDVSVDLVPAISIPSPDEGGWLPPWYKHHHLIKDMGCVLIPKTLSSGAEYMECGVSRWGKLFNTMPENMRQGYRMSKVVKDSAVCPQIEIGVCASEFISSYLLKQCILKEYVSCSEADSIPDVSDLAWSKRIYEVLEEAFRTGYLESFFVPGYNLLHNEKYVTYQEVAVNYARLCRRLLTEESAQHFRKAYMGIT